MPSNTPTPSLTPDICSLITINNFEFTEGEDIVTWDMSNANGFSVELTAIYLSWPSASSDLKDIKVGSTKVRDNPYPPGVYETVPALSVSVMLPQGVKKLHLHFVSDAVSSPYSGLITFDGCTPIPISS